MLPYFHTNGGDNLLFESWTPSSSGAIAGASIAIFALALLERFVNGFRGRLEVYWASNALGRPTEHPIQEDNSSCAKSDRPSSSDGSKLIPASRKRLVPPFVVAYDVPRGIIYMFQATITYALMLTAMTFQVAYFISIIVGLGVGEVMFGRWGSAIPHH